MVTGCDAVREESRWAVGRNGRVAGGGTGKDQGVAGGCGARASVPPFPPFPPLCPDSSSPPRPAEAHGKTKYVEKESQGQVSKQNPYFVFKMSCLTLAL